MITGVPDHEAIFFDPFGRLQAALESRSAQAARP